MEPEFFLRNQIRAVWFRKNQNPATLVRKTLDRWPCREISYIRTAATDLISTNWPVWHKITKKHKKVEYSIKICNFINWYFFGLCYLFRTLKFNILTMYTEHLRLRIFSLQYRKLAAVNNVPELASFFYSAGSWETIN